jgi:predicted TIM-barrel fold metal-dependent hydrolase
MGEFFMSSEPLASQYLEYRNFTDYPIFDADQHLTEGPDSFTRYIDKKYADRTLRVAEQDGKSVLMVDGVARARDDHADMAPHPGSLKEMLKGIKQGSSEGGTYQFMEPDPAFSNAELRIKQLDKQNIEACMLYSNGPGLLAEHLIRSNDLYYASTWSYLRYLEEEWGFARAGRLYVAPIFSMRDVDRTCEQLDWFFERGGKVLAMVPGPAYGRSPGDPHFDRIWGRINDAGATVSYHINEAVHGYKAQRSAAWGEEENPTFFTQSAWQWYWAYGDVPAQETFSSLIYSNLFQRFPNLKILSAEHGCEWVPLFIRKLDKMRGMGRNGRWIGGQLPERPSHIFKRHFRVVPFWEDDIAECAEQVGTEVLVGGSDFPHSEGLAFPTQMVEHLSTLDPDAQRAIMRDNGMALVGR